MNAQAISVIRHSYCIPQRLDFLFLAALFLIFDIYFFFLFFFWTDPEHAIRDDLGAKICYIGFHKDLIVVNRIHYCTSTKLFIAQGYFLSCVIFL